MKKYKFKNCSGKKYQCVHGYEKVFVVLMIVCPLGLATELNGKETP